MNYAQLDLTNNRYKRVNLINHDSILPHLIEQHPDDFVNLEGRSDTPLNTSDWYYDTEADRFLKDTELPQPEPPEPEPQIHEPTNAEISQRISDLEASLVIAGLIE